MGKSSASSADRAPQQIAFQPPVHVPGNFQSGCGRCARAEQIVDELNEVAHGAALGGYVAGEPGQMPAGDAAKDQEIVDGVQVAASPNSCASGLSLASFAMQMGP